MVIGIDPSSAKLAVVSSTRGREQFDYHVSKLSMDKTEAAGQAFVYMRDYFQLLLDGGWEPYVFQEAPVMGRGGAHATVVQAQVGGAIMAAASVSKVPLRLVNNQSWKKRICGNGGINKEEVAARMRDIWPELLEHAGKDQDMIDAGAINLFGWHVLALQDRLRRGSKNGS